MCYFEENKKQIASFELYFKSTYSFEWDSFIGNKRICLEYDISEVIVNQYEVNVDASNKLIGLRLGDSSNNFYGPIRDYSTQREVHKLRGPIIGATLYSENNKPVGIQFDMLARKDLICKGSRLLIDKLYAQPIEIVVPIDNEKHEATLD